MKLLFESSPIEPHMVVPRCVQVPRQSCRSVPRKRCRKVRLFLLLLRFLYLSLPPTLSLSLPLPLHPQVPEERCRSVPVTKPVQECTEVTCLLLKPNTLSPPRYRLRSAPPPPPRYNVPAPCVTPDLPSCRFPGPPAPSTRSRGVLRPRLAVTRYGLHSISY